MSALVLREATLSEVETRQDWRYFDFSRGEADDTSGRANGGGFAYKYTDSTRCIVWRATSGALDLVEYSLKGTLIGNAIRFDFGKDITPNVLFHEITTETEGVLVMIVVMYSSATSTASLKRFVFPHPRFIMNPLQTSIFDLDPEERLELSIDNDLKFVAKEVPKICELTDEMNVYIGCESGSIVHVQLEPLHEAQDFVEVVVRETGPLLSALRGLLPLGGKRQTPSVVGLSVFQNQLVFALYDDAKIRVWAPQRSNALILSIDVPAESWNPETPNTTSKWSLKILPQTLDGDEDDKQLFKLGVYIGMSGDSQIQLYHGTFSKASGAVSLVMEGVSYYGNDRFVDFSLSNGQSQTIDEDWLHPRIWGLWQGLQQEDGDFVLAHTQVSRSMLSNGEAPDSAACLEVNNWSEVALENSSSGLDSLLTPNPTMHLNLADSFLNLILQPGRFSSTIITHALQTFTNAEILRSQPSSMRELKAIVSYELRREIEHRQIAQGATQELQAWRVAHSAWTQFLEHCVQTWKDEHIPLALFCVPNSCGLVLIIKTGQITALRETSAVESLRLLSPRSRPTAQYALLSNFLPSLEAQLDLPMTLPTALQRGLSLNRSKLPTTNDNLIAELFKSLDTMSIITSQLGSAKLELFEKRLFNLTDPVASAACDVEFLFGSPLQQAPQFDSLLQDGIMSAEERMARRSFVNRFIRSARAVTRLDICMEQLLALIESSVRPENGSTSNSMLYPDLQGGNLPSSEIVDSELVEDVLARGFRQTVSSYFELLRDIMYLTLLCIRAELQLNLDPKVLKNLHAILPRVAEQLKAYHVLKWLSMQYVTGNPSEVDLDLPMRRLGPKVAVEAPTLRHRLAAGPISVIHLYILDIRSEITDENDDHAWRSLGSLIIKLINLVHPHSALGDKCSIANQLLFRGQYLSLFEYVRLLDSKSAYHRDLLGDCYLALAQYEKAIECFIQASINVELETNDFATLPPLTSSSSLTYSIYQNPLVHSIRQAVGRDRYERESLGLYYWKALLPDLVAQKMHDLVIKAANCALSSTHPSDEATFSELYLYIFKAALAIENHEQAYTAMIHITEDERKVEALSEFVLFFIEHGKAKELAELPFVNMLELVHEIIMKRAKSIEIVQPTPNLYQVLYAFHVAKCNYRLAAESMFVYAERLAVEHHVGIAILERYSAAVLAVLSALELTDPQHAYLTTSRPTPSAAANASPAKRPRETELVSDFSLLEIDKENHQDSSSKPLRQVEIYDIPRLKLMHLLAQCNIKLARKNRSLALTGLKSPHATLQLLIEHNIFTLAYRLADAAKLPMDEIFAKHTTACLALPNSSSITETERWGELRTNLEKFDLPTTNFHYLSVVADTILATDKRIHLPIWLIYTFKTGQIAPSSVSIANPEFTSVSGDSQMIIDPQSSQNAHEGPTDKSTHLMALYLKYGLLEDAAKLASEMILRSNLRLQNYTDTTTHFQNILPYQYIEQVLKQLQTVNAQLHAKIATSLTAYIDLAKDKTNLLLDQNLVE